MKQIFPLVGGDIRIFPMVIDGRHIIPMTIDNSHIVPMTPEPMRLPALKWGEKELAIEKELV